VKQHWCGYCRAFVTATVKPFGFYKVDKLHCDSCDQVIGTPG
jgi:hypothetical protein